VAETEPVAVPEAEAKPVPVDIKEDEATLLVPVHIKDELLPHDIKKYMTDLSMGPQAEYKFKMGDELLLLRKDPDTLVADLLRKERDKTREAKLLREYHDKALKAEVMQLKDPDKKLVVKLLRKDPDKNKGDMLLKDPDKKGTRPLQKGPGRCKKPS
jgi:hypothetical protein